MSTPTERNRLGAEGSPYLQAHADNPVNWQPWDQEALAAARERDVPIFLSIGYSSCHWCHVMAEESFEDPGIADQLNENFVSIKVDREERPEIDNIYMTVCQLVRQAGCGWPLSVWLTPAGKPFYVGTYYPKEPRQGQPGFGQLLEDIVESWETEREQIESRADQWMAAAKDHLEETPTPSVDGPDPELLAEAASSLVGRADREHGGFGGGQKFPQPSRLLLLAMAAGRTDVEDAESVLRETLDAMADRGLRDHLGGGFHRYCTDREWTVPHFEKMLYDNASIPLAYIWGYQLTGDDRYLDVATETFDFVEAELGHPDGGFYSALDARSVPPDSEGESDDPGRGVEGAYYVWTPKQVREAMASAEPHHRESVTATGIGAESGNGKQDSSELLADVAIDRYGITEAGNFEGKTVLTRSMTMADLATQYGIEESDAEALVQTADEILLEARANRPRPPRDEKILAGWNGLFVEALAEGALATGSDRYARLASDALAFLEAKLWDGDVLHRRFKATDAGSGSEEASEEIKGLGVLEDYAFLANGALSLHGVTGDLEPLAFALDLGRTIEREFWDPDHQTLYYTPAGGEELPVRPQDVADESTPSSMGVALDVLDKLDAFAPESNFRDIVSAVLQTHAGSIEDAPMQHPTLVRAATAHRDGHLEITLSATEPPSAWLELVGRRFLPDRLLTRRPPDDSTLETWLERLGLEEAPPIWAGRAATDGPTAYVCRQACSPPTDNVDDLESWIDEFSKSRH